MLESVSDPLFALIPRPKVGTFCTLWPTVKNSDMRHFMTSLWGKVYMTYLILNFWILIATVPSSNKRTANGVVVLSTLQTATTTNKHCLIDCQKQRQWLFNECFIIVICCHEKPEWHVRPLTCLLSLHFVLSHPSNCTVSIVSTSAWSFERRMFLMGR